MKHLIGIINDVSLPHKHKSYEVITYLKGNGVFVACDKKTPVCAGKIIIVPPGTVHNILPGKDAQRVYINGGIQSGF